MAAVLAFFIRLAPFIFILLAVGAIYGIRRMAQARTEVRGATYGLEREIAQHHMSQALSTLVVVGFLAFAEFVLVVFLVPNVPMLSQLSTPTMNPLFTPTTTFQLQSVVTPGKGTAAATPTLQATGCIPGQINIKSPKAGDQIQGLITLQGSANVPNFGFYKYEFAPTGSDHWATIVANNKVVNDNSLGDWDTSAIATGDYQLRLVVTDNQGNELPACVVPVRIKGK